MAYSESKVTSVLYIMHLLICIKHFIVAKKLPSNWLTRKLFTHKKSLMPKDIIQVFPFEVWTTLELILFDLEP